MTEAVTETMVSALDLVLMVMLGACQRVYSPCTSVISCPMKPLHQLMRLIRTNQLLLDARVFIPCLVST